MIRVFLVHIYEYLNVYMCVRAGTRKYCIDSSPFFSLALCSFVFPLSP